MEKQRKIALTGGGTAGHITPNLALIPTLKERNYNIIYIGSATGMEKDIMEKNNIPFFGITADKLRRYFDFKNFLMPFNVLKGISEARKILKEQKVDIIFSKGGFVAVPVVLAASSLKIPVISHEADISAGLANLIAAPFSVKVCCNFEEAARSFKDKGVHTGSPIRQEILNGDKTNGLKILGFNNDKNIILVTGGSLGSKYINDMIRANLDTILTDYNIVHQCGKGNLDENIVRDGYRQYELISENLNDIFAASDFVISRAGANIIFELLALKKPNILIPLSKRASRGDQILNAESFERKNYSIVLTEEEENSNRELIIEKLKILKDKKDSMIQSMSMANENNAINIICDLIDKY